VGAVTDAREAVNERLGDVGDEMRSALRVARRRTRP
jgi:hypothetical protein